MKKESTLRKVVRVWFVVVGIVFLGLSSYVVTSLVLHCGA